MITFAFESYKTEFPDWSKHHKKLGIHVKRVYENGEEILPNSEELRDLIAKNEALLQEKFVRLWDRTSGEEKNATDYYLPVYNTEYKQANLEYYSVGAMNTEQTTHVRLTFMLEYDKFMLDYAFKSSGSHAMNFYHQLSSTGFVEDMIEEILDEGKPIEETGITTAEDEYADYKIVLVTPIGEIIDVDIEKHELINGLVGIEVYQFDHIILDEPVPSEI